MAVSTRSAYAPALVFLAGAASSFGPCVASRFVAVTGMAAGRPRRATVALVCFFVTGLIGCYAAFGAVGTLLARAVHLSSYSYGVLAVALAVSGAVKLLRGKNVCDGRHDDAVTGSAGGALLLGAWFAFVVSPCCTPLIVGIVGYTSSAGDPLYGSALLACFGLGHALPLFPVAIGASSISRALSGHAVRQAAAVVSATLMIALGAYYAVLA